MRTDYRSTEVFIVLPAFNEAENLKLLLPKIDATLREDGLNYQLIVVNDGSSDKTAEVLCFWERRIPLRPIHHEVNMGLGKTIRDGLDFAAKMAQPNDIIVALDADNSHSPSHIRSMVQCVREGNDVVIASRYQNGSHVKGVPAHRLWLSYGARFLFQVFFPIRGVRDYTCGYRAYRASLLQAAFKKYGQTFVDREGFEVMVDILLKLRKMGALFREVPLVLRYDEKRGDSKMKVLRTIRRSLALIIQRKFVQN
ncbi:MAG: glycosyltransferase [Proteobacteria bacterium]|nr:glycosyltransferase [Pseudomonadota bacterium]